MFYKTKKLDEITYIETDYLSDREAETYVFRILTFSAYKLPISNSKKLREIAIVLPILNDILCHIVRFT